MKLEQSYVYVTTKRLIKSNLFCQKRIPNTSTGLFGPPLLLQYSFCLSQKSCLRS